MENEEGVNKQDEEDEGSSNKEIAFSVKLEKDIKLENEDDSENDVVFLKEYEHTPDSESNSDNDNGDDDNDVDILNCLERDGITLCEANNEEQHQAEVIADESNAKLEPKEDTPTNFEGLQKGVDSLLWEVEYNNMDGEVQVIDDSDTTLDQSPFLKDCTKCKFTTPDLNTLKDHLFNAHFKTDKNQKTPRKETGVIGSITLQIESTKFVKRRRPIPPYVHLNVNVQRIYSSMLMFSILQSTLIKTSPL